MSDPTPDLIPVDRFWSKVDRSGGPDACWLWLGAPNPSGYGGFHVPSLGGRAAHRVSYILNVGPIPAGLQLDHLCRVRHCVNPRHLEPVTLAENLRRGAESRHAEDTHCPHGHEWTPENTTYGTQGYRRCRTCRREGLRRARLNAQGWDLKPGDPLPPLYIKRVCHRGHNLMDPENVVMVQGRRRCRTCYVAAEERRRIARGR